MKTTANEEKTYQLRMSFGKANYILQRIVLFDLIQKCNLNTCFRCNQEIKSVDELSIDHIKPWLYSENPKELFFDLNNIAFSHKSCNYSNKRHKHLSHAKCKCKGVRFCNDQKRKPWRAEFGSHNGTIHLGYYQTAEEASRAYDSYVTEHYANQCVTNKDIDSLVP